MVKKILFLICIAVVMITGNAVAQDSGLPVNSAHYTPAITEQPVLQAAEPVISNADELSVTSCDSVPTTFAGGNGHNGNMFDVIAFNTLTIKKFTISPQDTAHFKFYFHVGTYRGIEDFAAGWFLMYTSPVLSPHASGRTVTLPTPITIPAGETYSFYITSSNVNANLNYTNDSVHTYAYLDSHIGITVGAGLKYPFCAGTAPFQFRKWNGRIGYCFSPTGIDEYQIPEITATLYPNPMENTATLQIDAPEPDNYTLTISDLLGNNVYTKTNITSEEIKIEKENMNAGIYFYHLQSRKGSTANGKFVIE
jgi:hypothetical protein